MSHQLNELSGSVSWEYGLLCVTATVSESNKKNSRIDDVSGCTPSLQTNMFSTLQIPMLLTHRRPDSCRWKIHRCFLQWSCSEWEAGSLISRAQCPVTNPSVLMFNPYKPSVRERLSSSFLSPKKTTPSTGGCSTRQPSQTRTVSQGRWMQIFSVLLHSEGREAHTGVLCDWLWPATDTWIRHSAER